MYEIDAFVRELDDDEATIYMVDSNMHRETILPSEKAIQLLDTVTLDFNALEKILPNNQGITEIKQLFTQLTALNLAQYCLFTPSLARGLNVYTGVVWEVFDATGQYTSSLGGGGRYDNLTGIFGLPNMSGGGISFGADRIYDVLKGLDKFPSEVTSTTRLLFANMGVEELKYLIPVVKSLREAGIACEIYPEQTKLKKQFDYADKKAIPFLSIVGGNEMAEGIINIKNLSSGEQKSFSKENMSEILEFLQ